MAVLLSCLASIGALTISATPVIPIRPVAPDIGICDPFYGAGFLPETAQTALEGLPVGFQPATYRVSPHAAPPLESNANDPNFLILPASSSSGNIRIYVELAGPSLPLRIRVVPDYIRSMAAYLIQSCVRRGGFGGFYTKGLQEPINYIVEPKSNLDGNYPTSTSFLTVTISQIGPPTFFPRTGDSEPKIAQILSSAAKKQEKKYHPQSPEAAIMERRKDRFRKIAETMEGSFDRDIYWWQNPSPPGTTANTTSGEGRIVENEQETE